MHKTHSILVHAKQSPWKEKAVQTLSRRAIQDLLDDQIGCIHIPGFLDEATCTMLVQGIERVGFDYYDDITPKVGRIGITQYEFRHRPKREYFEQVGLAESKHARIVAYAKGDPLERFVRAIRDDCRLPVERAREGSKVGGMLYSSRLVRQIPMAKLHMDFAALCAPEWSIGAVESQLTWNLYLQIPNGGGGECVVYNHQWKLEDDQTLDEVQPLSSYGYPKHVVEGSDAVTITPGLGDVVLFNTRNFHEVLPSRVASEKRLSLTTFLGRMPSGELVYWS